MVTSNQHNHGALRLRRGTDRLTVAYLLITAGFLVLFHARVSYWWIYVGLHLLASAGLFALRDTSPTRLLPRFLRDWYPALGFPWLYKEVEIFAAAFGNWGLTEPIQRLEVALFQGHPSLFLSEQFGWVPLSEYLHFCYFFYLLLLPVVGGVWYFTGRISAFRELLFSVCLTYYLNYLFYMLFPVDSPFYLFDPPGSPIAGHFFYDLVHQVSGRGGARGGAFPSSHVAVGVVVWLTAWRHQRRLSWLLAPVVLGIIVATVYGRFHYALDSITGIALGAMIPALGRRLVRHGSKSG